MVVVGADVHKLSHTFVAVDEAGRKIGEKTLRAITAGHAEAVMWVRERFGADVAINFGGTRTTSWPNPSKSRSRRADKCRQSSIAHTR